MRTKHYTKTMERWSLVNKERLIEAVNNSISVASALKKLSLATSGPRNYQIFYEKCKEFEISTVHFVGQAANKGKTFDSKRNHDDIFGGKVKINSSSLRQFLFKNKYKLEECEKCKITEWCGEPAPLELHHQDGNNKNNKLDNLMILCANCHANHHKNNPVQKRNVKTISEEDLVTSLRASETISGALKLLNLKSVPFYYDKCKILIAKHDIRMLVEQEKAPKEIKVKKEPVINYSKCECGATITKNAKRCGKCYHDSTKGQVKLASRKVERPTKEVLEKEILELPMLHLGKKYGVSDNSIRKWAKNYGIEIGKRLGYWAKKRAEEKKNGSHGDT